ncbi:MAG: glycosyltransferase family 4 protein [Sedimentisphaerales bacterium]|nr:glycosyltransferase family 4 protein [Sedimentisphaerales bacterium]
MKILKNILLLKGNYGQTGGPETLLNTILCELDRDNFSPTLVQLEKAGVPRAEVFCDERWNSIRQVLYWKGIAGSYFAARQLAHLAQAQKADLIHTHDMRANLLGYLFPMRRVPWIGQVHGWLGHTHSGRWRFYEGVDSRIIRKADLVLVGSTAALDEVRNSGVERVEMVPNAVPVPAEGAYEEKGRQIREKIGAGPGTVVIGMAGRIHPGKGQKYLIDALKLLVDKDRQIFGLIAGEGPDLEAIRQQAKDLGIAEKVEIPGYCEDVLEYASAMDVFVVPSLKESLPLTALEAMSIGKPIVASKVGDLPLVVAEGENGLLVEPGSAEELAAALDKLVGNEQLRRGMGVRSRETIVKDYSGQAMTRKLENVYIRVMDEYGNHE